MANWGRDVLPFLKEIGRVKYIASYRSSAWGKVECFISSMLHAILFGFAADIAHFNVAGPTSLVRKFSIALIYFAYRVPVIFHLHGGQLFSEDRKFWRACSKKILRFVARKGRLCVLSEELREKVIRVVGKADIYIIPNSANAWQRWKPSDVLRFVFAGNATVAKGFGDLVEAVQALPLEAAWELRVCGNGAALEMAKEALAEQIQKGRVIVHGWVEREVVHGLLACGGVLVLPSYWEGLPLSVLEALAIGAPVVATPVGGVPEYVDGSCGVLVPPGDPQTLSAVLLSLIEDPTTVRGLAEGASKVKVLSARETAELIMQMYKGA